jgi:formylglycine-generating enzyme required for sulfatase activity
MIPAGEFDMGDHHDLGGQEHSSDEVPIHRVRLDSFSIATTETTNRHYCEYLNSAIEQGLIEVRDGLVYSRGGEVPYCDTNLSDPASSILWNDGKFTAIGGRADHPAVCIRWHGAAAYCNWRSRQEGYETCYDPATWQCDFAKKGFRLPTEAEWEYAGRGGLCGPYYVFPWGDEPDVSKANWPNSGDPFETGSLAWTTPVGFYDGKLHRKADFGWPGNQQTYQTSDGSNGYGLYDVAGNVWEWVGDWYDHNYYGTSPLDNPHGPDQGQPMQDGKPYRVLRGGSWYNGQWGHSRVSNRNPSYYRGPDDPNHRWYHIGFRVTLNTANTN